MDIKNYTLQAYSSKKKPILDSQIDKVVLNLMKKEKVNEKIKEESLKKVIKKNPENIALKIFKKDKKKNQDKENYLKIDNLKTLIDQYQDKEIIRLKLLNANKQKEEDFLNTEPDNKEIAKYLTVISKDEASEFLKKYPDDTLFKIIREIMKKPKIKIGEKELLIKKFNFIKDKEKINKPVIGGKEIAKDLLLKSLDEKRANSIYNKVIVPKKIKVKSLADFKELDSFLIYNTLKKEKDHIKAVIISQLDSLQASKILKMMNKEERKNILLNLSKMKNIDMFAINIIKEQFSKKLKIIQENEFINLDGEDILKNIFQNIPKKQAKEIFDDLQGDDTIGAGIKAKFYDLSMILKIDDRDLQNILIGYEDNDIALIMKGKSEEVKYKLFQNVSNKRKENILKEYEIIGKTHVNKINKATDDFISFIKILIQEENLIGF